ncbi:hypothetical protein [Aquimarina sp. 2201CG5-10]|uniref:hypothetical protein n=1 Tax=Aquimarina callyspongiae TaxID=3098150 RepID=UPI002AB52142|nr:hypothetical protein [Aquimarina sp. 2201CG5-10]MDY8138644.1 hypothetical protein [Aquimarina sp. 2201CG5-10]
MKEYRNKEYIQEANHITNYLVSESLLEDETDNYINAMKQLNLDLNPYESLLWKNMLRSKWRMACIDAGLALKDPGNIVRRKIFIMLAILEASPNYTKHFLSKDFSVFYLIKIAWIGFRSIVRAIVGIIMIKKIRSQCN